MNDYSSVQQPANALKPEFVRLPRCGQRCPITGLSRSTLNSLILPTSENAFRPPVISRVLAKRGRIRGVRLIVYDSLMEFLYGQDPPTREEESVPNEESL